MDTLVGLVLLVVFQVALQLVPLWKFFLTRLAFKGALKWEPDMYK